MQSKVTTSLLTIQRLKTLPSTSPSTASAEFSTPSFGGSIWNHAYILDCGNDPVTVGNGARCMGTHMPACNLSTRNIGKWVCQGTSGRGGNHAPSSCCPAGQVLQGFVVRSGLFVPGGMFFCRNEFDSPRQKNSIDFLMMLIARPGCQKICRKKLRIITLLHTPRKIRGVACG